MIRVFKLTKEQFYPTVAGRYLQEIYRLSRKKREALTLGLATGGTMDPLYEEIARLCLDPRELERLGLNTIDIKRVLESARAFGLDEYLEFARQLEKILREGGSIGEALEQGMISPDSYRFYYHKNWTIPLGLKPECVEVPSSETDPETYSDRIQKVGRIDIQFFGIGKDGHLGFLMPCANFERHHFRTHISELSDSTRQANSRFFEGELSRVPTKAITMGMGDMLHMNGRAWLLAFGKAKADAVQQMLEEDVSSMCPASWLQHHANLCVFLDEDASSKLKKTPFFGISEDPLVFE